MVTYADIDRSKLEQTADAFYGRMKPQEADIVRATVDDVAGYMKRLGRGQFLIAGVGGILRFEDPKLAEDIDLAVVGLKYTFEPGTARTHSFDHVLNFTECVQGYFQNVVARLREGREEYGLLHGSGATFSTGSGPFKGWDEGFGGKKGDSSVEARSHLEQFGWYDSKGLQIKHNDSRPVDVQFVFNKTPEEWKANQEKIKDFKSDRGGKAEKFFYATLLEQL